VNITTAQSQWYRRPADERFTSLQAMHAAALTDRQESIERTLPVRDLTIRVADTGTQAERIVINGKTNAASLTHYAFSQLSSIAGAPAGYMRRLPAPLAAECLSHGLRAIVDAATREQHKLYLRVPRHHDGTPNTDALQAKAITSGDYARIYDVDIIERLIRVQEASPAWHLPTDWNHTPSGAFRGDRDMFVLMVDGGSIVEDPTIRTDSSTGSEGRALYRGVIVRNSEVGHCALTLSTFMFRFVCGNLCIWGAENVRTIRRRHVGSSYSLMARVSEGMRHARDFAARPASMDESAIRLLNARELGKTQDEVIRVGQDAGLSAPVARLSYDLAMTHEDNPRSVWGYAQGITRASQQTTDGATDDRFQIDRIAGQLLTKYTRALA
jgi:Domain of unknown function (DUF932)